MNQNAISHDFMNLLVVILLESVEVLLVRTSSLHCGGQWITKLNCLVLLFSSLFSLDRESESAFYSGTRNFLAEVNCP